MESICLLPTVDCLLPTAHCLLPTAVQGGEGHCRLSTVNCQLLTLKRRPQRNEHEKGKPA
jgi:hypothetical protein